MNPRSLLASAAVLCPLAVSSCTSHDTPPVQVHARPHWGNAADWAPYLPTTTTAPPAPVDTSAEPEASGSLESPPSGSVNHEDESPPAGTGAGNTGQPHGAFDCIRARESGGLTDPNGDYSDPNGGAYQVEDATLHGMGYSGTASDYSPAQQDAMAMELYNARGYQPWSTAGACGVA